MAQKPPQGNQPTPQNAVAIIGVGCRFPGANDLESFWQVLRDGIETVGDYPGGRFSLLDGFYGIGPGEKGDAVTRRGGFLKDLDLLDAGFFGISPREATLLDPQHRLLLELGWEALEDAGLPVNTVAGTSTGVFIGQWTSDFEACVNESSNEPHLYSTTGSGRYAASARLAFHFDLRGPNFTVDTACSSSLVAIHLACQSLRSGESELALAGAVNLILRPEITRAYGSAGMLSPDGRCKFGDSSANGYVRSEAAGVVVLKLLSRALADGDPIHAVIRGSAVNNDGRSSGLLVSPSREAQAAMIKAAIEDAALSPADIDYIEAHGTGTIAGDPVELEAIGNALGEVPRQLPCIVGSVKTNVGHAEAAAGMAGLCKTILALQYGTIPATLHYRKPNPAIQWDRLPLFIGSTAQPWPHERESRFAGLNSFGITGTNAHLILQNAGNDSQGLLVPPGEGVKDHLYLISARTPTALEQLADGWRKQILSEGQWPASMGDLAFTAAVRRTFHDYRVAFVARDREELDEQLSGFLRGEPGEYVHSGRVPTTPRRIVFVFPGQGGQWIGMGRDLFAQDGVFRETLSRCDRAIREHTGWSVIDYLMNAAAYAPGEIDRIQPTLFAVMISLAEVWRAWGVEPHAVVGHSMGEVAAAVVSGALSLEDGAAVISLRSRLMKTASGRGRMAMAGLTMGEATEFIQHFNGRISIAANNGPASTVLSGDGDAIAEALATLEAQEVFCRSIQVDVASHCAHMDPICAEFLRTIKPLTPRRARVPLYSTSTGKVEDGPALNMEYWARNLREPVLFAGAIQQLLAEGHNSFIEINSHPVLLPSIEDGARAAGIEVLTVSSLRREKPARPEMLAAVGKLHVAGYPVDFRRLYPSGNCMRLPAYPWQRERYWPDEGKANNRSWTRRGTHSSLGAHIESSLANGHHYYDVEFRPSAGPLDTAGWCLDVVLSAGCDILNSRTIILEEVKFQSLPNAIKAGQLAIAPGTGGILNFRLMAKSDESWTCCCEGVVRLGIASSTPTISGEGTPRTVPPESTPISACVQLAAEQLGYTPGDQGWCVSRISRIDLYSAPETDMRIHAKADIQYEHRSDCLLERADGTCVARLLGVNFDVSHKPNCSRHIYEWKWIETALPRNVDDPTGVFIIIGDARIAAQIGSSLSTRNVGCVFLPDPDSVRDVIESFGSACRAVIWTSAERTSDPEAVVEQVNDITNLVRGITKANRSGPLALWLTTSGAKVCPHDPTVPSASQAAIWGLARVIAREHPELQCISVDLSAVPATEEFDTFARLAVGSPKEEQIAIRETRTYGLRLERRQETMDVYPTLRRDGVYLITGGTGGLGLALAAQLAQLGAGQIVLLARRQPSQEAWDAIKEIESAGALVICFQADVGSREELSEALTQIATRVGPLKGIFHLAGITHDALLVDSAHEEIGSVIRSKAGGAWNLHRLTLNYALDYFVMYSSLAAAISQPGQGSYAAANAYLDGLAALRHMIGLPASSLQWGPWRDTGMMQHAGAFRSRLAWAEQGIGSFSIEDALDCQRRLLVRPAATHLVVPVDWKRFALSSGGRLPQQFCAFAETVDRDSHASGGIREQLTSRPVRERLPILESHLKKVLAGVLKSQPSRIDPSSPFASLGVDSIMAVDFARRVTDTTGIRLPVTALFNFPTLELLTREVDKRLELDPNVGRPVQSPARPAAHAATVSARSSFPLIGQMTEEEAVLSFVREREANK